MWKIPIACPDIGEEEARAVYEVVKSGWINEGKKVAEFEERFAEYIGVKHAVACVNGTAALHLILLAYHIGPGDEVIVPSMTFISTATSVLYVGAKPVFADIDPRTFNIDPYWIENYLKKRLSTDDCQLSTRPKAIIPVHYGGQAADMEEILEIADRYGLYVFEDAAEAHGAQYKGKRVGSFGHAAMFSFTPTKNITTGEGGMITTNNGEIAQRIRCLKNHGQDGEYHHVLLGYNYRMTEMQAVMGLEQLKKLPSILSRKEENAFFFSERLSSIEGIIPPYVAPYRNHTYMIYTVKVIEEKLGINPIRCLLSNGVDRDTLRKRLKEKGIQTKVYFPPLHLQPIFRRMGYGEGMLPATEAISSQILSLPFYSRLRREEIEWIVNSIQATVYS